MLLLEVLLCVIATVALAHLVAGRIPDWLFVFLPCIFFVPDLFYMESASDWITAVGTLLGGLATIGLLAVASEGISAWRKEMLGKEEYDAAKSLIKTLLSIHEFLIVFNHEWQRATPDQSEVYRHYNAIEEKLETAYADAYILWGREWCAAYLDEIRRALLQMGLGSMGECDDADRRAEYIATVTDGTTVAMDVLRRKAHGNAV